MFMTDEYKYLSLTFAAVFLCNTANGAFYEAVDGDSLVEGSRRIRLDEIDAPEFVQSCYNEVGKEYPCGLASLKYLQKLLLNADIHCDCLPQTDKYGREVCECFADEISINRAMVFAGYAMTYRSDKYAEAQADAQKHKRGIWQGKFMRPALYRALEKIQTKQQNNK